MPRIHVFLRAGKPEAYRKAILDNLYESLRETLDVPEDDRFMTLSEHGDADFQYGGAYGIARSADIVYIQITVFDTRTPEQKRALFQRVVERLGEHPGIRPQDIFINVYATPKENWFLGGS